jgi:hypothetical protein
VRNAASLRRHPRAGLAYHVFTSDRRARVSRRGERTPPEVALLTVGDSFSWGHGVENEDTYTARLAERWERARGQPRLLRLRHRAVAADAAAQPRPPPRVVVYGFIADHMKRNVSPCAPAYGPLVPAVLLHGPRRAGAPVVRPPDRRLFAVNRRFWDDFFFAKSIGPRQLWAAAHAEWTRLARTPRPEAPDDPATRERILERLLGDMARAAGSVGARLVVVNIPYFERGGTSPMPRP